MLLLYFAALLAVSIGTVHSLLGERYVLRRIEQRDLPKLILGGRDQMREVLRFAWHITTVAWVGFAGILMLMAHDQLSNATVGWVIAATFLVTGAISGIASGGRHLSWIVFVLIGAIALQAAMTFNGSPSGL